ncbi:uncharacterized protein LOC131842368 [Achroia grisella]|uniref:uncharacterized protein LOC131842368 n=1 Tax=Achroia grisella TaxID=688607 RepID=UPI0027D30D37|nr:uncharacterized protein LOC131842368 [Achroia grisella]
MVKRLSTSTDLTAKGDHISGVMNAVILLLFITYVHCITEEENQLLHKRQMECVEETKVNPNSVLKLKGGYWKNAHPTLKKWCLCLLNKYGFMSKEGVFKMDVAMSRVPDIDKQSVERMIDNCLPKKTKEAYNIAWEFIKCYHLQTKSKKYKDQKFHYLYLM